MSPGPRVCLAPRRYGEPGGSGVAPAPAEEVGARSGLRPLARLLPHQHLEAGRMTGPLAQLEVGERTCLSHVSVSMQAHHTVLCGSPRSCVVALPIQGPPCLRTPLSAPRKEERAVRDRSLLQFRDLEQPIPWKVQFNLGNSSRPSNQCRNSVQGKHLITDELGYICKRKHLLASGCCDVRVPSTRQYNCDGCLPSGCCGTYEHCVSCCLQPGKQLLLERFLNRAAVAFQNLFMAVEDHFELCLAKCRTSSQSVQHENTYRDPVAKYCYGESPPELLLV